MKELSEKSPKTVAEAKDVICAFSYEWIVTTQVLGAGTAFP